MKKATYFLGVIFILISIDGFSQDGSPDLSFGNNGVVITDINDTEDNAYAVAQAPSNRIIVGGYTSSLNFSNDFIVVYLEDGSLDNSFGDNGILLTEHNNEFIRDVFVQEDEKIIIGKGSNSIFKIYRYFPEGLLDTNFGEDGQLSPFSSNEIKSSIILTQEGKILVCGYNNVNGNFLLRRFLQNGEIDTNFGENGSINYAFGSELNQSKGKVQIMNDGSFVIGIKIINDEETSNIMVRFSVDGFIDTDFGDNGIIAVPVEESFNCSPLLFTNGDVLSRCQYFNSSIEEHVRTTIKFHSDGTIDLSFGNDGYIQDYFGEIIQENQRILHVSRDYDWEGGLTIGMSRHFANGSLDPSFEFQPNPITMGPAVISQLNSGNILITGSNIWYNWPIEIILQQFNNNPLSVSDFNLSNISIYPNPSKNIFTMDYDKIDTEQNYQVFDVLGKEILKGQLGAFQTKLDLSSVQSGMYFLNFQGNSYRLLKE